MSRWTGRHSYYAPPHSDRIYVPFGHTGRDEKADVVLSALYWQCPKCGAAEVGNRCMLCGTDKQLGGTP